MAAADRHLFQPTPDSVPRDLIGCPWARDRGLLAEIAQREDRRGLSARQSGFRVSKRHVSVHKLQLPQLP